MKTSTSPPKEIFWGPTIYCSKQTKLTKKTKTTDTPRKTHSVWSNKNIVFWKVTWFLPMKKGCLGGILKLWRLYFLDISWGDAWASPSLSFCPFFNSSHHSPIPTLENFQVSTQNHHIYSIYYCSNFSKSSVIKKLKRKRLSGKHKYWQKSVKIEQLKKVKFFRDFILLKSKSVQLTKVWI
jgi:hypothetical protein